MSTFLENVKKQINDPQGNRCLPAGWSRIRRSDLFQLIEHFERLDNEVRARYASESNISLAEGKTRELQEWQCSDGTGSGSFNDYSRDGLRKQDEPTEASGDLRGFGSSEAIFWTGR